MVASSNGALRRTLAIPVSIVDISVEIQLIRSSSEVLLSANQLRIVQFVDGHLV